MNLLVLTQVIDKDDSVLGFFHGWVEEFAKRIEHVEVVCLQEGRHVLPTNVRVYSLGKERGRTPSFLYALRFLRLAWKLRHSYDSVFVHMNPEYLVLAGWWWRLSGKRTVLWYSHRNVDLKLRIAAFFADAIASSASVSFRLRTRKLTVLGHGIDTAYFTPHSHTPRESWRIMSVGRITPIKRLETAVEALALLRKKGVNAELHLIGQPVTASDEGYAENLRRKAREFQVERWVHFRGAVPYEEIVRHYQEADISLNLAPTGGLDKAVLESMACGLPTVLSNEGFADFLGPYRNRLLFAQENAKDLANKLEALHYATDRPALGQYLREQAVARAGLERLIERLLIMLCPSK